MRPATPLICEFIDAHNDAYGVAPICRALAVHGVAIAPRTYWAHRVSAPSKRVLWDTTITEILAGYYEPDAEGKRPPECLYGSLKMWAHLQRQDIPVARCTVEKIMRHNGWRGVTRDRRPPRTTEPDPGAARAPDLVGRRWRVAAPNLLEVADFTYVPMTAGFGYTAFVIDAYAGVIPGWECSLRKDTGFVERALRHAVAFRARQGHPFDDAVHHSDAGSHGGFNRLSQHLDREVFGGVIRKVIEEGGVGTDRCPSAMGRRSGVAGPDAFSRAAGALSCGGTRVLEPDCYRGHQRGCGGRGRRVDAGRDEMVSTRWRDAADHLDRAHWPLPVVR